MRRKPRAFAYLFILTTTLLVVVIGVGGLAVARIEFRTNQDAGDSAAAMTYAHSAISIGLVLISQDEDWRVSMPPGTWINNESVGSGTMSLLASLVADGDGNTLDDDLVLTGIGVQGDAVHRTQVTLRQRSSAITIVPQSWKHAVSTAPAAID